MIWSNWHIFKDDEDFLKFQEELEEDDEARRNINIYRDPNARPDSEMGDDEIPKIDLAEMLEMVNLDTKPTKPMETWI